MAIKSQLVIPAVVAMPGEGGGGGSWGSITGDIQNQEDLQAEFDTKIDKSEGVFTDETLLGGENIEIVPQPIGFDANTLACWHFDGDLIDAKNSLELTPSSSNASSSTEAYKFGTASMKIRTAGTYAQCVSATFQSLFTGDFTIDFWVRKVAAAVGNAGFTIFGLSNDTSGTNVGDFPFYFSLGQKGTIYPYDNKTLRVNNTKLGTAEITVDNLFHHIALVFIHSNSTVTGYLDGVTAGTYTFSTLPSNTQNLCFYDNNGGGYYVEEFRISNVARWTEDFTPPTTPYPNGDPTGNYVVNMVNTNNKYLENDGTYLQNSATGTNSLTVLGSDDGKDNAVNIGNQTTVGKNSVCIGQHALSPYAESVAVGQDSLTSTYATAIGRNAHATGTR